MNMINFSNPATLNNPVRLFDQLFENNAFQNTNTEWMPAANVLETEEGFFIDLAIPGIAKDAVKLEIANRSLIVSGERKATENEHTNYQRKEFSYGNFSRSFRIPEKVDTATISAEYNNGMLHISLPTKAEEKPRTVEIL